MSKQSEDVKKTDELQDQDLEMLNMDDIGKKKKRKKTVFDYIRYVIMLVAGIVFVVSGYQIYDIFSEYSKGEKTYEQVMDNFAQEDDVTSPAVEVTGAVVETKNFNRYLPDFVKLQEANTDVKGWIQFEGIPEISYPILQRENDNDYYLKRMWNGEENTAGSIFLDAYNSSEFSDYNTFIYGHNMKNLSMFGRLKEYKDQAFYQGKEYFWIYTPTANYQYQIFSIHEVKSTGGFFKTFETKGDEYSYYIEECKKGSYYDTGVVVTGEDKIVTLSTCTARGDDWRLILHGKLVGTEIKR